MPENKEKITVIIAALMIISAIGIVTYYDAQGNILVSNATVNVTVDNTTKIIDQRFDTESNITTITVIQGKSDITDSIASKSVGAKNSILSAATKSALKDVKYPYIISGTEVTILKSKCGNFYNDGNQICGYWISCTRKGEEIATNSPILISPPPYEVVVSDVLDTKTNTQTITLKEDPKAAAEEVLKGYCDRQPLGKAVSYER
jgi:hypothetical protein